MWRWSLVLNVHVLWSRKNASKEAGIVSRMPKFDVLKRHLGMVEEGASLMPEAIRDHVLQLHANEVASFSAEAALCSPHFLLQVVRASESSLQEELGQSKLDMNRLEKHC